MLGTQTLNPTPKFVVQSAGMGDVLSLVEMAEKNIKENEAEALTKRMMQNKFDFNDFLKQYKMVSGMGGGMTNVMKMLPGLDLQKALTSSLLTLCMHLI